VQIHRYAKVQEWTFVNSTLSNRKKGWVVRTYVEKIRGSVTHKNSPLIRRITSQKSFTLLFERTQESDAGNERARLRRLAQENATIPQAYDCPLEKLL
jgi:hypothetical protein